MKELTFLIPVYNDWKNLQILLEKIDLQVQELNYQFDVIILNDFSSINHNINVKNFKKIKHLKIINFNKNLGSQRAIAIGLKYIYEINKNSDEKIIIVMDSDGQDDPGILDKIIKIYENSPNKVITINRSQRSEPLWFKILYEIHYHVLIIFSGRKIRYGNYILLINSFLLSQSADSLFQLGSLDKLKKILSNGDLWAAYSAAISKSYKLTHKFFHKRNPRYSGSAKMNLYKLFIHSLRIFSVFKYQVLLSSIIYCLIFFFLGSSFYFLIFLLLFSNILNFIISANNKKKFDATFNSIISNIDTLR